MTLKSNAVSIAEQLHYECTILLELFRKKESFSSSLTGADVRLVPVQQSSDNEGRLWGLYSALVLCQALMDKAMSKEEEELGSGEMGEYEKQRRIVYERLKYLIATIWNLLETKLCSSVGTEVECPTLLFELKLWIYSVFKEIHFWAEMAGSILLQLESAKGPSRSRTGRSTVIAENREKFDIDGECTRKYSTIFNVM
ncbi:unnamed protein product [Knipowitschia caucasica]|uniref:Uncharacterized protein n=1 Tax=Knipowitschia caucasica TaxID=637954 RepID=A0AAV2LP10_KNICA